VLAIDVEEESETSELEVLPKQLRPIVNSIAHLNSISSVAKLAFD